MAIETDPTMLERAKALVYGEFDIAGYVGCVDKLKQGL